jgi:hypothetical protein
MKKLINKIKAWFNSNEEIQEAERFEDWFHRLNPERKIDCDVFNQFQENLRNQLSYENENYKNHKKPGIKRRYFRVA